MRGIGRQWVRLWEEVGIDGAKEGAL
jgi:hypothetical protein